MSPHQRLKFPQLRNEDWVREHVDQLANDLGAASIADEIQCTLQTAKRAIWRFGFYRQNRPWSAIEVRALEVFYPRVQASLIAQALNRTNHATWKHAWRMRIKSRERPYKAATPEQIGEFWDSWRRFILEELVARHSEQSVILKFTWRPARFESDCESCTLRNTCPRDRSILPCERMTVGDYLTEGVIDERDA